MYTNYVLSKLMFYQISIKGETILNLDFFKNLANNLKENEVVQNFMQEIGEYLENNTQEETRNISIASRNTIRNKKNEILKKYENKLSTEEINEQISKMENEVLERQTQKLKDFRKEGHFYRVEEDRENRIFLADTETNIVLEEVDFPKELLSKAKEGAMFQYKNGQYHFCS